MKENYPMRRGLLILICATVPGGCINVTIDPTKPIEVHAVVDVSVKSADTQPPDVFDEAGVKSAKPAEPVKPVAKPGQP